MKLSVIVYGVGDFYRKNGTYIENKFNVCGFVDKKFRKDLLPGNIDECTGKPVFGDINKCNIAYEAIFIASDAPHIIFDIINQLKICGIPAEKVLVGISYFGLFSEYFDFELSNNYDLQISNNYGKCSVKNKDDFTKKVKSLMRELAVAKGGKAKEQLSKLYEDELKILWFDGQLWCMDHDIDIYHRYYKHGFINWGFNAVFALMVLKHFINPYVMELGCGDAYYFTHLYKNINCIKYLGVDIDEELIERAKQNNNLECDKCSFVQADITKEVPFPKEKMNFDAVIWVGSYSVFNDIDQKKILDKVQKRLGDSGILFISDYYSEEKDCPWVYSINPVRDKNKLREKFEKLFKNVFIYIDKDAEAFYLMASNGDLPVRN